jgi:hypothetical protein
MYEELVKRLREPCQYENCVLCQQAANAIEELSCEYESISKSLTESVELVRKLQSPRWIPVTERLPELYKPVYVMDIMGSWWITTAGINLNYTIRHYL